LYFQHPVSGRKMHVEAPLPAELLRVLEKLRTRSGISTIA
jgi:hypothetical protein